MTAMVVLRHVLGCWICCGAFVCGVSTAAAEQALPLAEFQPTREWIVRGQEAQEADDSDRSLDLDIGDSSETGADHIETDRDSFTPATSLAGRGRTIAELAYSFIDNPGTLEAHSFPELLVRYGLTDRIELRLGWNYEIGGESGAVSSSEGGLEEEAATSEEEGTLLYGMKLKITDQAGWRPRSAVLAKAFTPTAGPDQQTDFGLFYVFGWEFSNRWQLDAAMRYLAVGTEEDHFNEWAPSIVLKVPIHERWNAHVEYFGIFFEGSRRDRQLHYFSPGLHYLLTPNFELGTRLGWGLNGDASQFFVNTGIGARF